MTSLPNSLASTPPMGWNSWNMFGENISATSIRETADALVSSGLKNHGYNYIVIDDCWSKKDGRDSHAILIPDPDKFPNGIKALADYVHNLGFRIGIYSNAADKTCAGYPGSYGFEEQDAQLWASWGIDFLKYDYCHAPLSDQPVAIERYSRMGEALRNTGREFLFSLCEWGNQSPHLWGRKVGGHMGACREMCMIAGSTFGCTAAMPSVWMYQLIPQQTCMNTVDPVVGTISICWSSA